MIEKIISEAATYLVVAVVGIVGSYAAKVLNKQAASIHNEQLREAALVAVKWAADKYVEGHGVEKLADAIERLQERYPKVNGRRIEEEIRAAYKDFKNGLVY